MTDLRTLAQAVVDAVAVYEADHRASAPWSPVRDALEDLGMFLGGGVGVTHARAILAALDAERAQGYARAMGEVVERCEQEADYTGRSDYQCNRTLRRFTRRVEWEYGTLCVIYDPLT